MVGREVVKYLIPYPSDVLIKVWHKCVYKGLCEIIQNGIRRI